MRTLLTFLLFLISTPSFAYLVFSDVDDTIKITNSGNPAQAAWRGVFTKDVFPGMTDVYKAWAQDGAKVHFITASPSMLRGKIRELLTTHQVPYESLTTRRNVLESKFSYKVREHRKIMDRYPDEPVVLVGDDVGQDPEVFQELMRLYPERGLATYIRPVRNRAALPDQIPYVTSYDVASQELREGRVSFELIGRTSIATLTGEAKKLLPKFTWCPTDVRSTQLPVVRSPFPIAWSIIQRVERICRERQSALEEVLLVAENR